MNCAFIIPFFMYLKMLHKKVWTYIAKVFLKMSTITAVAKIVHFKQFNTHSNAMENMSLSLSD